MTKIAILIIVPAITAIYVTAPSIWIFASAMIKVTAALGG
jgi:hypothetical protein